MSADNFDRPIETRIARHASTPRIAQSVCRTGSRSSNLARWRRWDLRAFPNSVELPPSSCRAKTSSGQARTGTGKTAAFGMPILQMIEPEGRMQALVLDPDSRTGRPGGRRIPAHLPIHRRSTAFPYTAELAMKQQLHQLGSAARRRRHARARDGRVASRRLQFESVRFVVLDEVDRMLDIGFRDDIRNILRQIDPSPSDHLRLGHARRRDQAARPAST